MTTPQGKQPTASIDPDLQKVGPALLRAAENARELVLRTGTPCYVWRDGKLVNIGGVQANAANKTKTSEKA